MNTIRSRFLSAIALGFLTTGALSSDWNQWRGPNRNGVLTAGPKLADIWSTDGPTRVWESEDIPSNDDGGHGSSVIADGKVYMSVVWHNDVPSPTRTVDQLVQRRLGYQRLGDVPKEVVEKLEKIVLNLSARIRGQQLEELADKWIEDNLSSKQKVNYASFIKARFKKGSKAIPFADFDKLETVKDKPFPNHEAFLKWVDEQGFSEGVKAQIIKAVPPTRRVAKDTVICLDLKTGKTLWRAEAPGKPIGRNCSSTPVVAHGKVFAMGSTCLYCVNAENGDIIWSIPFKSAALGSSPMVVNDLLVVNMGVLTAYDIDTGKERWSNKSARMSNSSPALWSKGDTTLIIANARSTIGAYDPATGATVWEVPGGGDSTPAIHGDILAVQSRNEKLGLIAVQLDVKEPKTLWTFPFEARRTQASPVIDQNRVYLIDNSKGYCLDLASGKKIWEQAIQAAITSPVLVDNKLYLITDRGNNLTMYKLSKSELTELGKTRIQALWCPSPSVADGYIVVRKADRFVCYDLRDGAAGNN